MRWVLVFLVIFNGIIYWWYSHQGQQPKRLDVGSLSQEVLIKEETPRLVLLSELTNSATKPSVTKPIILQTETETETETVPHLVVPETYEERFEREDLQSSPKLVVDASRAGLAPEGSTGGAPDSVSVPEMDPVCGLLGPFNDVITAKQFRYRLSTVELAGSIKKELVPGDTIYWVYIEPRSSRKEALALLRELQAKKIDSFVITEGELKNGLSLGFFKQKKSAKRIQNERIKEGYRAKLKIKQKTREQYWVVLQPDQLPKLSDSLLKELSKDFQILQNRKNLCEQVAPMENIE